MDFGDKLKFLREEINLSREDLAVSLNITYSALSKYETNNRFPDKDTLKKIAKYFNVSLDYLMGLTDVRNPSIVDVEGEFIEDKTLTDDLINLMIRYGIIKDKNSVNEKHLEFIKYAIETYKNEHDNK
ncbi:helix-turn-helix domain-containing protein [Clostridium thailandense]|uniref:helix-turn-helix domain-containing protein n=1 Tax=Clostridium thailandense TaxID=2794346 RepID=UPI003989E7B7